MIRKQFKMADSRVLRPDPANIYINAYPSRRLPANHTFQSSRSIAICKNFNVSDVSWRGHVHFNVSATALQCFIKWMDAAFAKGIIYSRLICAPLLFRHAIVNLSLRRLTFIIYSHCRWKIKIVFPLFVFWLKYTLIPESTPAQLVSIGCGRSKTICSLISYAFD